MFSIVVCGCTGGPKESNLSCYLVSSGNSNEWIALDAGTLITGFEKAIAQGNLTGNSYDFFRQQLKAYLISHAHLDHVAGLVINSQIDTPKSIYGRDVTLDALRDHLFNGCIWPNFATEGKNPIGLYTYKRVKLEKEMPIEGTNMALTAYPLLHDTSCQSTAFLIRYEQSYLLYLGDTAPDNEREKKLASLWKAVGPHLKEKKLKAIFLECSYPAGRGGEGGRFHLDSHSWMDQMNALSRYGSVKDLLVFVTHRKESMKLDVDTPKIIEEELTRANSLGIRLIFPVQGQRINL